MNWLFSPYLPRVLTIVSTAGKIAVIMALALIVMYLGFLDWGGAQDSAMYQASW